MTLGPIRVALQVADALEACGLLHLVGGSVASSFAGEPRTTLDVDMVVAMAETDVDRFLVAFRSEFYADSAGIRRAIRQHSSANLIHQPSAIKVDLFIAGGSRLRAASSSVDPKHAELVSAFLTASRSGDIATLTRLLASDARVVSDGGGKVPAALNVIEGADRVASFLVGVVRKGLTDEMTVRFETINGLPGLIVSGPIGLVQTNAFEIENDVVKAIYVVRNPDKLRHLTAS